MENLLLNGNTAFTLEEGTRGIVSSQDPVTLVSHTDEGKKIVGTGNKIKFIVTDGVEDLEVLADESTLYALEYQTKYERSNPSDPIPHEEILERANEDTDSKMRRYIYEAMAMAIGDIGDADIREELEDFDIDGDGMLTAHELAAIPMSEQVPETPATSAEQDLPPPPEENPPESTT
jgi:hypothetical protein